MLSISRKNSRICVIKIPNWLAEKISSENVISGDLMITRLNVEEGVLFPVDTKMGENDEAKSKFLIGVPDLIIR